MNKYYEIEKGKFFKVLNKNNDPIYIVFYAWDNKEHITYIVLVIQI